MLIQHRRTDSGQQIYDSSKAISVSEENLHDIKFCRICFQNGVDDTFSDNPFISPCKCIGVLKDAHQECLNFWINSQLEKQEKGEDIDEIICALCKTPIAYE